MRGHHEIFKSSSKTQMEVSLNFIECFCIRCLYENVNCEWSEYKANPNFGAVF